MAVVKTWGAKQKREHASRLLEAEAVLETLAIVEAAALVRVDLAQEALTESRRATIAAMHARDRVEVEPIIARLPDDLREHMMQVKAPCQRRCPLCTGLARLKLVERVTGSRWGTKTTRYCTTPRGRKVRDALLHAETAKESDLVAPSEPWA